jgi:glycosyltransferase involved in cell wall biosynthesis
MRFVLPGKLEGIGWYSLETATRMARMHPECSFDWVFDRPFDPALLPGPHVRGHVVGPPARHPLLWYAWFEGSLPGALKRLRPDVFFSPDGYCSLRSRVPTLMTVHDLAFEHYRDHVPRLVGAYYRHFSPRYARRAERLLAVSGATRDDLLACYGLDPDRVEVVHNGVSERFRPLSPAEQEDARAQFAAGRPYFIYVGSVHPRKNLERLLRAFDRYADADAGQDLLLAGRMAWQTGGVRETLQSMKHRNRVHLAGHMEPGPLQLALGGASALLYPSLHEGFGIPIAEAMQADVPVMTSNRSSMPEVAGAAALLVNPESEGEMAEAMQRLSLDAGLREQLIAAGRVQRQQFSWDRCASQTWQALLRVAKQGR